MALFELTDIRFNYKDQELYENVSLKVNSGEHCCLVGKNGCGKTTLIKLLTVELHPDHGAVYWTPGVTYSYLHQNLDNSDVRVIDYFYEVYQDLFQKEKKMEKLYEEASINPDKAEKLLLQAENLQNELFNSSFYALQEKVGRLIDGLSFPKDHLEKPLSNLSGGQKEKAMLIKMLLEEKDVLLLDEPTNFLDQNQVTWLADYLQKYPKAFLVISHDQEFLKQIADVVFILENKTITRYRGSYEHFLTQHELDKEQYQKNYEAQQRYIKKEELFIAKHIVRATSSRAAKSHRARLSHLVRLEEPKKEDNKVTFRFPFSHDVGEKPLIVDDLTIGYEHPLLEGISFILKKGEKIAILGQNGIGKTTFVKTLLNKIPALGGSFTWLPGTVINYYSQEETMPLELTAFEYIKSYYPDLTNTEIRTILGTCGVKKEKAMRPLRELSGGEVTKVRFALMSLKKSNFLILDEPTNHLDQAAKDSLFTAIKAYPGAVILISHEKDFYDGLLDYELTF